MRFFNQDDDLIFVEEYRKPGVGRVNERVSIFSLTAEERAYQTDKIVRNITADYERLGTVGTPWLAEFDECSSK
jgi:hypothetical protein